jgi:hypothetical protein
VRRKLNVELERKAAGLTDTQQLPEKEAGLSESNFCAIHVPKHRTTFLEASIKSHERRHSNQGTQMR